MTGRYKIIILLLTIVVLWKTFQSLRLKSKGADIDNSINNVLLQKETQKVKISVYYEALCSDSRNFVIKQLVPTFEKLQNFINLDLIPYGKAKTKEENNEITFSCQHGPRECLANKIHACVLQYVHDASLQLQFVACMIDDNMLPREIAEKCGTELGVSLDAIFECSNNNEGAKLLKEYGIRTDKVSPPISFIPTVELDGSQKVPLGWILKNLTKELCALLLYQPPECL